MKKRVYLIHGWGGRPEGGFRPWLKKELEKRGFEVEIPAMPDTDKPKIESWLAVFNSAVGIPDINTVIVGHSLGGNLAVRFIDQLPEEMIIGKLILVAPALDRINELAEEEKAIYRPWREDDIDFEKVKRQTKEIVAFFSDNDRWIPLETEKLVREKLGGKIIVESGKGHFSDDEGVTEFQGLLEEILNTKFLDND